MSARGKITRSRDSVHQALYQTNQAMQWIEGELQSIQHDFQRQKTFPTTLTSFSTFENAPNIVQHAFQRQKKLLTTFDKIFDDRKCSQQRSTRF